MQDSRKLIVANWKMEPQTRLEAVALMRKIAKKARALEHARAVVCPPAVFLSVWKKAAGAPSCALGAQDVFWEDRGAHTGEISPFMLTDAGATYVLVGHSERRARGDTDDMIEKKLRAVLAHGLTVILCVGEKVRDEEGGYLRVVEGELRSALQKVGKDALSHVVIAYEPVWAVGQGAHRADTPGEFFEMSIFIRKIIGKMFGTNAAHAARVLYGGSVDEKNAGGFLKEGNADGLLVGRASLDAKKFSAILDVAEKA